MARRAATKAEFDVELAGLPPDLRWRTWMGRVEAVIFASPQPVSREVLSRVVGAPCNLDLLIDDIRDALRDRPYELVAVAGGWQHRTRAIFSEAVHAAGSVAALGPALSQHEAAVLMAVAYFQPINRGELSKILGRPVSRDTIAALRSDGFIGAGPRSPQPGAPYTYVTTPVFLSSFGFDSLSELPDREALEDAGLLRRDRLLRDAADDFDLPGGEVEEDAGMDDDA